MTATMRINRSLMTAQQIAAIMVERYGNAGAVKYLTRQVAAAGVANYAQKYVRALAIVSARASLVTYPVTRQDGRIANVTIPQD